MRVFTALLAFACACGTGAVRLQSAPPIPTSQMPSWYKEQPGGPGSDSVIVRIAAYRSEDINREIGAALLDTLRQEFFRCKAAEVAYDFRRADSVNTDGIPKEVFRAYWTDADGRHNLWEYRLAIPAARFRELTRQELPRVISNREAVAECMKKEGLF